MIDKEGAEMRPFFLPKCLEIRKPLLSLHKQKQITMAKATRNSAGGTSFHGTTFKATPRQLIDLFPNSYYDENSGDDKTNFDFTLETESGDVFTIYDWKYYRRLRMDEVIEWHVGAFNGSVSEQGKREVLALLK